MLVIDDQLQTRNVLDHFQLNSATIKALACNAQHIFVAFYHAVDLLEACICAKHTPLEMVCSDTPTVRPRESDQPIRCKLGGHGPFRSHAMRINDFKVMNVLITMDQWNWSNITWLTRTNELSRSSTTSQLMDDLC